MTLSAPAAPDRLYLFDTTLRDGAQTTGVDFSLEDKRQVATLLDRLGVDYVEGGYPGANPLDSEFFLQKPTKKARFVAFGMTKRAGRSVSNDPGFNALLDNAADSVCLVAKAWDYHVHVALGISLEENIESITESVAAIVAHGKEAMLDCEHFFDGFKANPSYAVSCAKAAHAAGARWVVLCDTNGGTLPHEVSRIVAEVVKEIPGDRLGIHAHNDTENAVANSLAAILGGVRQLQGTINGLGERCGNANLISLIPTLMLKPDFAERFETGIPQGNLRKLKHVSHVLDEILNRAPNRHQAYVGDNAFAHKGGLHASAVAKDPHTYEHVTPESVGNARKILVSNQAGRSNIIQRLDELGLTVPNNHPGISRLLDEVKEREAQGYAYEGADASFFLLAKRVLGEVPEFFKVERFKVNVERRYNASGELVTVAEAIAKVRVGDEVFISAAEGNGPVNALDVALRKDLGKYQHLIAGLGLYDYKVRIFHGGSDAVTRVLIESGDELGGRWTTVGVSSNIIDASFQALIDSITYKLLISGAAV